LNWIQYWAPIGISNIGLFWLTNQSRRLQRKGMINHKMQKERDRTKSHYLKSTCQCSCHNWDIEDFGINPFICSMSKNLARSTIPLKSRQKNAIWRRDNLGALHNWRDWRGIVTNIWSSSWWPVINLIATFAGSRRFSGVRLKGKRKQVSMC
jgi:hypothetical protein